MTPLEKILAATSDGPQIQQPDGSWMVCCKAHGDTEPSLHVTEDHQGTVGITCYTGCDWKKICHAMAMTQDELFFDYGQRNRTSRNHNGSGSGSGSTSSSCQSSFKKKKKNRLPNEFIAATYDYRDSDGVLVYQAVRYENPEGKKRFSQRRPNPEQKGMWIDSVKGVNRVLYRLPELIQADKSLPVFIVEGEKKVEALRNWGYTATCNVGGAGKWLQSYVTYFRGRDVVLMADNDPPNEITGKSTGREHVKKIGSQLNGNAKSVRFLDLPNLPPKGDIVDWIADGGTKERFNELLTELFAASSAPFDPTSTSPLEASGASGKNSPGDSSSASSGSSPTPNNPLFAIDDPERLATTFMKLHAIGDANRHILWHSNFYSWNGRHYKLLGKDEITADISNHVQQEFINDAVLKLIEYKANSSGDDKGPPTAKKNSTKLVSDVMQRFKSLAVIPDETPSPAWLHSEPEGFDSAEIVCLKNGILNLRKYTAGEDGYLIPHSPGYFNTFSLPYDFDPNAPQPMEWIRFLEDVWGADVDSIKCLQEFIGLLLVPNTSYQKILLIIGPRRSGKGTIARIIESLIGEANVAGPTLAGLATNFGLQPLVGRPVAIIADARVSGQMDVSSVTEKLLMISGEDAVTIDRKNKEGVTVVLPTRFILMSNEIPRLIDTSNALSGRLITLQMVNSFYGQEDLNLKTRLLKELPGIFNWAIEGWKRLKENERFTIAASSEDLADELEEISSPMGSFVREQCLTDSAYKIETTKLYDAWKSWCADHGRDKPGAMSSFGIQLRAVVPGLRKERPRLGGDRAQYYVGIKLKPDNFGHQSEKPPSQGEFGYQD